MARKNRPQAIRTERTFDVSRAHAILKLLPSGEDKATIVEARIRRKGEDRYSRARHLEMTAPVSLMGLPPEAVEAIEAKRAKMAQKGDLA